MCFHFLYNVQEEKKKKRKSSLQLMIVSAFTSWNSKNKITYSTQVILYSVLQKKKTTSL